MWKFQCKQYDILKQQNLAECIVSFCFFEEKYKYCGEIQTVKIFFARKSVSQTEIALHVTASFRNRVLAKFSRQTISVLME